MSFTPWDIQAGRNISNMSNGSLIGLLCALLTIGGCVGCLNICLKEKESKPKKINEERRLIHEFYDVNTNKLYDAHSVFFEQGTNREVIEESKYDKEYTEEYIRRNFLPQGDEIRFLRK